ncbi:MAG: cytochrome c oxidase subunit II [Candidatus Acidiferrum sp.]
MEIAWTIAPILLLVYIFTITVHPMHESDPAVPDGRQPDLVIVGHQWWWEARYLDSHVVTANEIHVPVEKRLLVRLESADVIHDWWVPQRGRKMDAIPGHPNLFWLEADAPGTDLGTCAEFCGAEHAWMLIRVIAQPDAKFELWTKRQLQISLAPAPSDGDAAKGARLFQQLTCSRCHAIEGTSANAQIGPNLTHVTSRETLAAGVITNTLDNMAKWLSNPQTVKPECRMPNFELTKEQVHYLSAYLETLR